jgi:hypothetical protein
MNRLPQIAVETDLDTETKRQACAERPELKELAQGEGPTRE